jgi:lipopolysaccharide biosynthesis regulator YciM
VPALFRLGQINLQKGKLSEATEYFEAFVEKEPDKICLVSKVLIDSYSKMGNTEDASRIEKEAEKNCK